MARRKRSMFRRDNTMISRSVQPRRTSGAFDWIASNASVDATGAPQTGSAILPSWGGAVAVASQGVVTVQAVIVQPTPMASTPTVGRLRIDEIRGRICVANGDSVPGDYFTAVAIYVADLNNTTTLWNVRNPLVLAEASRDDYLFFEGKLWRGPAVAGETSTSEAICFDLKISQPIIIGGGQALHVSIACAGGSSLDKGGTPVSTEVTTFFRTRVGPVA